MSTAVKPSLWVVSSSASPCWPLRSHCSSPAWRGRIKPVCQARAANTDSYSANTSIRTPVTKYLACFCSFGGNGSRAIRNSFIGAPRARSVFHSKTSSTSLRERAAPSKVRIAALVDASGRATDHFRWRNKPALVIRSERAATSSEGSAMLLSSKAGRIRSRGRLTDEARLITKPPRLRSS